MKFAVTGSHGLVGSALFSELKAQGHSPIRMVRKKEEADGIDSFFWSADMRQDLAAHEAALSQLSGVQGVVHLAGENIAGRWSEEMKAKIKNSRIQATRTLAEDLLTVSTSSNSKPPLICASAIGFYGDRGDELLTERSSPGTGFLADLCRDWEKEAQAVEKNQIRAVNLRLGVVLSKKGGALSKMLLPFQMGAGGQIGSGKQYMSWIGLDDVVSIIIRCLTDVRLSGPVNVVAPDPVTNIEFTKALGKVLGRPTIMPLPAFAARLVMGEMADELLLSSTRVIPEKLTQAGFQFKYPGVEDALRHAVSS